MSVLGDYTDPEFCDHENVVVKEASQTGKYRVCNDCDRYIGEVNES